MLWLAEPEHERRQIRQIVHSGAIDGVIIVPMLTNETLVQALSESHLPFVLVSRYLADARVNYVDADNIRGARDAVRHLLRLGRARIATITGPQNTIAGIDRLTGYTQALREAGLPTGPELIADGAFSEAGGYDAMRDLLPRSPDAVFVAGDVMAIGALRALREAKLRVPDDVALVTFDDTLLAANAEPPLTTIRRPTHQLGRLAVETLIQLVEYPDSAPHRIVLPTELVVRSSCGAPLS
jgi:DNA-binding LacI/PurR family transcriptional regulator